MGNLKLNGSKHMKTLRKKNQEQNDLQGVGVYSQK